MSINCWGKLIQNEIGLSVKIGTVGNSYYRPVREKLLAAFDCFCHKFCTGKVESCNCFV